MIEYLGKTANELKTMHPEQCVVWRAKHSSTHVVAVPSRQSHFVMCDTTGDAFRVCSLPVTSLEAAIAIAKAYDQDGI